jgi:hypothetical protein
VYHAVPIQAVAPPAARVATSWTRPLQYTVVAAFGIYALYSISLPFWFGAQMSSYMRQIALQQAQRSPELYPNPGQYADTMASVMQVGLAIGVVVVLVVVAVVVIGTLRLWTWMFYAVLALLALAVIGLPFALASILGVTPQVSGLSPPLAANVASAGFGLAAAGLAAWMVAALVARGPWAKRRPLPGAQ